MWGCRWGCAVLVVVLLLGATGGCGADRPVKVTGVVTLDGAPVAGAVVDFQPAAGTGRPATGMTDENGAFRLATQTEDGAFPGQYKVVVTKTEYQEGQSKKSARKSLLPAVYSSASTTPLSCTVPPPGPVTLELKKKP